MSVFIISISVPLDVLIVAAIFHALSVFVRRNVTSFVPWTKPACAVQFGAEAVTDWIVAPLRRDDKSTVILDGSVVAPA